MTCFVVSEGHFVSVLPVCSCSLSRALNLLLHPIDALLTVQPLNYIMQPLVVILCVWELSLVLTTCIKGAWTYCIINEQDQPTAKECNRKLCYRQKLEKLFCASKNGTLTVSDRSTTRVPKSSRGFYNYPYGTVKTLEKSCPVVDLSCLIVKTLCEVVCDAEKLLSVDFQR